MEEQLTPTSPAPAQPTPEIPVKKMVNWKMILGITAGMIAVLGIGIGIGMLWRNYQRPTAYVTTSPAPTPTPDPTANWKTYTINSNGLSFKYPSDEQIITDIKNTTELKADEEYRVGVGGSDIVYLDLFIYKSTKSPSVWWDSEGKSRFEKLAKESGKITNPPVVFDLIYKTTDTTVAGNEALSVTISSNNQTPYIPKINNLVIFQSQGYITMATYHDIESYPGLGLQILSTFKFVEQKVDMTGCSTRNKDFFYSMVVPNEWTIAKTEDNENRTSYKISGGGSANITIMCDTAGVGSVICVNGGEKLRDGCFWEENADGKLQGQFNLKNIFGSFVFRSSGIEKQLLDQMLSTFKF